MNILSNRSFKIWAYTVSHSTLILRSEIKFEDEEGWSENTSFNIDIEFFAVAYIDIPHFLPNITLHEVVINIPDRFQHYKERLGYKVFEIKSSDNVYFIVAGGYVIGKSSWISEDRIINMQLKYDEILATS
ncbi:MULTISPECIES: hypothetical protein [unclassified Arcicella]|uniref:hypothetical protein n=1 Tax=unclassified Arcicella TaxID=2644986 RepID=UPI00285FE7DF|nr:MULTISPECIES: hypothetical protein [unclassified Arcicella]MDR6560934.1 hypothetical protein [Arcicella sp. BE51]MDR6810818.1 hypothetical protein [Arcicella sp. BE140]MDR6822168.1 hypothetical protein [Arcicella sp. BE139]